MIIKVEVPNCASEFWEVSSAQYDVLRRLQEIGNFKPEIMLIEKIKIIKMGEEKEGNL